MKPFIRSRVLVACFALFCMLFMQLAVASYSCPMEIHAVQAMPDCQGMDMPQPTLCHTHATGEAVKQSLDKFELPQLQPFISAQLVQEIQRSDFSFTASVRAPVAPLLNRSTSPPVSILHCCFRI